MESARRDAKRRMNSTHGDNELRRNWVWAKEEMFEIDKELMFINNLLNILRGVK